MKPDSTCELKENLLATTIGISLAGLAIGITASFLQNQGNPPNMGVCVACFERDIAGALGLHAAKVVQYLRPEVPAFVLGSFLAAVSAKEFTPRFGSAPLIRFVLGIFAMLGALVFLGCPWRAVLRLAGGDWNALAGIAGLGTGIYIGTLFFRRGFSLGPSKVKSKITGFIFPVLMLALLALRFIFPPSADNTTESVLHYSQTGPGSQYAPVWISLIAGLFIGALAQRSRFCTMGAFRDIFLFRQFHLFIGLACLFVGAFGANLLFGQFHAGFAGQPIAHTDGLWNFMGMVLAGLAFALAGGCPGRQLFASGEGNADAAIFALGMFGGAAIAHNFSIASTAAGPSSNSAVAVMAGLAVCLIIGFVYSRKK